MLEEPRRGNPRPLVGLVGANPHLLAYVATPADGPVSEYLDRVQLRFGHWILDTSQMPSDTDWLASCEEFGAGTFRLTSSRQTAFLAASIVQLRHIVAFIYPLTMTARPFLANGDH